MNSLSTVLYTISFMALPLLIAMVFHEYAHGWVAQYFGDSTARDQGRLTLNPLAHIDPFGTVIMPLLCLLVPGGFFIGWAKPVPIMPNRLYHPRRDMAFVAAAGPGMNFLLAIASGVLLNLLLLIDPTLAADWPPRPGMVPRQDLLGMILLPLTAMSLYSILLMSC